MEQVRKKGSRGTGTNSNGAEGGVQKVLAEEESSNKSTILPQKNH